MIFEALEEVMVGRIFVEVGCVCFCVEVFVIVGFFDGLVAVVPVWHLEFFDAD